MKGDFSRSSFDSRKHYRGVRLQQGRVQLDADWNEQVDILLHQNEREVRDMLGAHGIPHTSSGFAITLPSAPAIAEATDTNDTLMPPDVQVGAGQRYVDGICCTNETVCAFTNQPDFPGAAQQRQEVAGNAQQLVYLDVWQHHVSAREDPDLREVALEGVDTTTRIKTVAQVKFWPLPTGLVDDDTSKLSTVFGAFLAQKQQPKGMLAARKSEKGAILQNQLYRVEIHSVEKGVENGLAQEKVRFKWSRENGAVAYSIEEITSSSENTTQIDIHLKGVKPDQLDLRINDWVEISGEHETLDSKAGVFARVVEIQPDVPLIIVQPIVPHTPLDYTQKYKSLQRWDQAVPWNPKALGNAKESGTILVIGGEWMTLENGLQVKFKQTGAYAVGDYWLIPARATLNGGAGGIIWPTAKKGDPDELVPLETFPAGINHHYAALALLQHTQNQWQMIEDESVRFRTLPILTGEVDELTEQMAEVKTEIVELKDRVTKLEKAVAEIEILVKLEQSSLYQNFKADSMQQLGEGDVVALDPEAADHVVKANLSNETLVIGVVHRVIAGAFPYRVVLQGRVRCKVIGAVKPGTLLTPAELDGHARQGGFYLQPGTILGKALRAHIPDKPEDVGEVEVMVTLN